MAHKQNDTPLRAVSVGYREGGPVIWAADDEAGDIRPLSLTNAEAFSLVNQLVRAIQFPVDA